MTVTYTRSLFKLDKNIYVPASVDPPKGVHISFETMNGTHENMYKCLAHADSDINLTFDTHDNCSLFFRNLNVFAHQHIHSITYSPDNDWSLTLENKIISAFKGQFRNFWVYTKMLAQSEKPTLGYVKLNTKQGHRFVVYNEYDMTLYVWLLNNMNEYKALKRLEHRKDVQKRLKMSGLISELDFRKTAESKTINALMVIEENLYDIV